MKYQNLSKQNYEIVLVVDNVRSRFNVGSFFRTADAAGIKKIYLGGITPAPPHPKIDKVALGAQKTVPFEKLTNTTKIIKQLKKSGYKIIALEKTNKSKNIFDIKIQPPVALIVGSETKGISPTILKLADKIIFIPMFGKKESLNVSVAFGVAAYLILQKTLK